MESNYYMPTEWLTAKQVAAELAMDYKRVLEWIKRAKDPLPAYLIDGNKKQVRIYRPELNAWIVRNSELLNAA